MLACSFQGFTNQLQCVALQVENKRYFDVLRSLSDYWYDAGTQIKKGFYVDVDNDVVWKSRPLRSAGVEAFTGGDHIISYQVIRDVSSSQT